MYCVLLYIRMYFMCVCIICLHVYIVCIYTDPINVSLRIYFYRSKIVSMMRTLHGLKIKLQRSCNVVKNNENSDG